VSPGRIDIVLRFGATITGPTDDGVRMSVAVNGKELWSETQPRKEQSHPAAVDLSAYAGQSIQLTLHADARGNNAGDWSHWLQPAIVAETGAEGRRREAGPAVSRRGRLSLQRRERSRPAGC